MNKAILSLLLLGYASAQPVTTDCTNNIQADGSCLIMPNTIVNVLGETVLVNPADARTTTIDCSPPGAPQCAGSRLTVTGAAPFNYDLIADCIRQDSCIGATFNLGDNTGFAIPPQGYGGVDINCLGIGSCNGIIVNINGNFPQGVTINAIATDGLLNAVVNCNVAPGQVCTILCDNLESTPNMPGSAGCTGSTFTCLNGERCITCRGTSCPNIVFPIGSDPEAPVVIGPSPNIPGLDCLAGTDDNLPDECRDPPFTKFPTITGDIICSENFDCCICALIDCTDDCGSVICNGDSSCIGVPMNIDGDDATGASIVCDGDVSCQFSVINGVDIVRISGGGDLSIFGGTINANLLPGGLPEALRGLSIPCNGDSSCRGVTMNAHDVTNVFCDGDNSCQRTIGNIICKIIGLDKGCVMSCGGDLSCFASTWNIQNVQAIFAGGDVAIAFSTWNFVFVPNGGPLGCGGDESCENSTFTGTGLSSIGCAGDLSCLFTNYDFQCRTFGTDGGCPISCGGDGSCSGSIWFVEGGTGFSAGGERAVTNAILLLLFVASGGGVSCNGIEACLDSQLTIDNVNGVSCGGIRACIRSNFDFLCIENGCNLICGGSSACVDADWNVFNAAGLTCMGPGSCIGATQVLDCVGGTTGCDILCAGANACQGVNYEVTNAARLNCGSPSACIDSTFNLLGAADGMFIQCTGVNGCLRSTFNAFSVRQIQCGTSGCENTTAVVGCNDMGMKGCPMECAGTRACFNAKWNITNGGGLICTTGASACANTIFRFTNNLDGAFTCSGARTCYNSRFFGLDNMLGFTCMNTEACANSIIQGSCNSDSCVVTCGGINACSGANMDIANVKEFKCDGAMSCSNNQMFKVTTNNPAFKVSCSSPNSCVASTFEIISLMSQIGGASCSGTNSCQGAIFVFEGANEPVIVNEIKCTAPGACTEGTEFILRNAFITESMFNSGCSNNLACPDGILPLRCFDSFGDELSPEDCIIFS